jgi:hypothetical protein
VGEIVTPTNLVAHFLSKANADTPLSVIEVGHVLASCKERLRDLVGEYFPERQRGNGRITASR